MYDFDEINAILAAMVDEHMIEPIDDPNIQVHLDEWAEVVGVVNEFYPEYDDFQDDGSF